jgi:type VI protein secretion system component Hcp
MFIIRTTGLALAMAGLMMGTPATAVEMYLNVPSIAGEQAVPGYPGVMELSELTIAPLTLTVTKEIDSASTAIFTATALGTPMGTVSTLLYNGAPGAQPDAKLDFFNTLISSYQTVGGTTEEFSFSADNPVQLYLDVPGIPGANGTPGYPNAMLIESFTLTSSSFTIVKLQDSASDDLLLANAQGVQFADARLLLYDALPPGAEPDAMLDFQNLLVTASQSVSDPVRPLEQHTFSFETLSQPVPEPGTGLLIAVAGAATALSRRRSLRGETSLRARV